jgi:hypothetical protein
MEIDFLQVSGTIIIVLIGTIGYFMNRLVRIVDRLEATVNKMQVLMAKQEERLSQVERNCALRYEEYKSK